MAVYTEKKTYHTKAHMGMIDVTEDFQHAVEEACRQHGISAGTVTGFTTGGVAGLTTLVRAGHCEPRPEGGAGCVLPLSG